MVPAGTRQRRALVRSLLLGVLFLGLLAIFYRTVLGATGPTTGTHAERGTRTTGAIRVTNAAGLQKALNDPRGGYTVELAPGRYGWVNLGGDAARPRFAKMVTIRSAEPCNPAVFGHLGLQGLSNLTIEGLRFENPDFFNRPREKMYAPNGHVLNLDLLRTDSVSDIVIRGNSFEGPLVHIPGAGLPDEGYSWGFGWKAFKAKNVTFTGNEAIGLYKTISVRLIDGLTITDNSLHDYRSDAMYLADVKNVTITGNRLSDPRPRLGVQGDHPDFIQIEGIANGRIENNYMDIGTLSNDSQGIFSRAGTDMVVRNNVILTRTVNALMFASLVNGDIENNLVVNAVLPPDLSHIVPGTRALRAADPDPQHLSQRAHDREHRVQIQLQFRQGGAADGDDRAEQPAGPDRRSRRAQLLSLRGARAAGSIVGGALHRQCLAAIAAAGRRARSYKVRLSGAGKVTSACCLPAVLTPRNASPCSSGADGSAARKSASVALRITQHVGADLQRRLGRGGLRHHLRLVIGGD